MKKLFKNFKLSAFGILFIILGVVTLATWFVPAGEYTYMCGEQEAFVYKNADGKQTAVCPINDYERDELLLIQAKNEDTMIEDIEILIAANDNREEPIYTYQELEPKKQGLWSLAQAPVEGFIAAVEIIAFVFVIGGFINLVIKSGAMDAGIYSLLNRFKGREILLIPILMILFALGGTSFGMAEETIVFYVILIPVLYRAGFDNAVGMMVIALGAGVGVLTSTVNPFAIGVASTAANISPGMGIISRLIFFAILLTITIIYVMNYAKKVKNDPTKSINYDKIEELNQEFNSEEKINEVKMTGAHKGVLVTFALTFILMILSVIPWQSAFEIELFEQLAEVINGLPIPIIGGTNGILAFGHWYFVEMTALFLIGSFIIGCIIRANDLIKEDDTMVNIFIEGARDMLGVALIIGLARGIQIILEASGMAPTVLYYGSQLLSNLPQALFVILTYIFYIPLSFLVPSTSGLATATMPIVGDLANSVFGDVNGKVQAITAFSAASGIVNLLTPTSGIVMAALAIAKMDYGRWIKLITPLLVIIFVVTILFLYLTTTFNFYM